MEQFEDLNNRVRNNVDAVLKRIALAAERSGRRPDSVKLLAVSKYATCTDGVIAALVRAGCHRLGENRPQILLNKIDYFDKKGQNPLPLQVEWNLIGSLQKNKIRKILPYVALIHSVDTIKLLSEIDRIASEEQNAPTVPSAPVPARIPVLLEVNISGEGSKHGFTPESLPDLFPETLQYKNVEIRGLMGMAALNGTPQAIRSQFAALRQLRDLCIKKFAPPDSFYDLSMGMSHDFEIAIEEGATIVRIGSILYP